MPVWSGIRQQHRPAIKSFHGLIALAFSIDFTKNKLDDSELNGREKEYLQNKLEDFYLKAQETIKSLEEVSKFTRIGRQIFDELGLMSAA